MDDFFLTHFENICCVLQDLNLQEHQTVYKYYTNFKFKWKCTRGWVNGVDLGCLVEADFFASPTTVNTYTTPPSVPAINGTLLNNKRQLYHTLNLKPTYIQQVNSTCITHLRYLNWHH